MGVRRRKGRGPPFLYHCHPLAPDCHQPNSGRPADQQACLSPASPTHLQGKGPILIPPRTAALQVQPPEDSHSTSARPGKMKGMCFNLGEILVRAGGGEGGGQNGWMGSGWAAEVTRIGRKLRQEKSSFIFTSAII